MSIRLLYQNRPNTFECVDEERRYIPARQDNLYGPLFYFMVTSCTQIFSLSAIPHQTPLHLHFTCLSLEINGHFLLGYQTNASFSLSITIDNVSCLGLIPFSNMLCYGYKICDVGFSWRKTSFTSIIIPGVLTLLCFISRPKFSVLLTEHRLSPCLLYHSHCFYVMETQSMYWIFCSEYF